MEVQFWSQLLTTKNILIYLIFINILTFLTMWYDKHEAKTNSWRISEKTLFILTLIGGSIGGIAGMYTFRHKTQKWYFKYGFPAILIVQIVIIIAGKCFLINK